MTILPSLFESRSRSPLLPRRERFGDLEDVMESFFTQVPVWTGNGRQFPIDIEELDNRYMVYAEIPGIQKKDVEVTLQDRVLTIQVNREKEFEDKGKNYLRKECYRGAASRSIMLPHAASEMDVQAILKDGVLSVTVNKEPAERTKKIAIH